MISWQILTVEQEQHFAIALLPSADRVAEDWQRQQDRQSQDQLQKAQRGAEEKIATETNTWEPKELVMERDSHDRSEQPQSWAVEKTKNSPAFSPNDVELPSKGEQQENTEEVDREEGEGENTGEACQTSAEFTAEENVGHVKNGNNEAQAGVDNAAARSVELEPLSRVESGVNPVGVGDGKNGDVGEEDEVCLSQVWQFLSQYYAIPHDHVTFWIPEHIHNIW